jgi:hypothetical protein
MLNSFGNNINPSYSDERKTRIPTKASRKMVHVCIGDRTNLINLVKSGEAVNALTSAMPSKGDMDEARARTQFHKGREGKSDEENMVSTSGHKFPQHSTLRQRVLHNHLSELCRPSNSNGGKARRLTTSKSSSTSPVWRSTTDCLCFPPAKSTCDLATGSRTISRSNVTDNPAIPQIADASYAGGSHIVHFNSRLLNRTHNMLRTCSQSNNSANKNSRKPKARCTTPVERNQSQARSCVRLLGG